MKELIQIVVLVVVLGALAGLADGRVLTLTVNENTYRVGLALGQK
jgi:hypothetical protein